VRRLHTKGNFSMTDRRYRGKQSRPIPVWNGVLEHRERIGDAIWEFLWCLDAITQETDSVGIVHGGAPVKAERIAADLKRDVETTRKNLRKLREKKYIRTRRTAYGFVIEVLNSKKFGIWQKEKHPTGVSLPKRNTPQVSQIHPTGVNKEDSAVERQQKAAAAATPVTPKPEDSVWSFLEIQPCGPLSFRTLLETGWARRNGGPYSILIGDTLDAWEAAESKKPRGCAPLFRALSKLREREKRNPTPSAVASETIHMLTPEEIPS
jgi:hypothetical protein